MSSLDAASLFSVNGLVAVITGAGSGKPSAFAFGDILKVPKASV
jgi:ATP:corrinoid adenosyltransferase